jgi:hypothetical protein
VLLGEADEGAGERDSADEGLDFHAGLHMPCWE